MLFPEAHNWIADLRYFPSFCPGQGEEKEDKRDTPREPSSLRWGTLSLLQSSRERTGIPGPWLVLLLESEEPFSEDSQKETRG